MPTAITRTILAPILAVFLAACGGPITGPHESYNPGGDQTITKRPRLVVETDGLLHDRLMGGQVCKFLPTTGTCEKRCYPPEPTFRACGGDGIEYLYTRQYLTRVQTWGINRTRQDPACGGDETVTLVKLVQQTPEWAHPCDSPGEYSQSTLTDRIWYVARPPELEPATVKDIPLDYQQY